MAGPLPLNQRIEFLEACVELERARYLALDQWSYAQRPEREKSVKHIDFLLDELAGCYLERNMIPPA